MVQIVREKEGVSVAGFDEDEEIVLIRYLRPSRLHEEICYIKRKRKVDVYFLLCYGEIIICKYKVDELKLKTFARIFNRVMNIIEKKYSKLAQYVDNKFLQYEKKLFEMKLKHT